MGIVTFQLRGLKGNMSSPYMPVHWAYGKALWDDETTRWKKLGSLNPHLEESLSEANQELQANPHWAATSHS